MQLEIESLITFLQKANQPGMLVLVSVLVLVFVLVLLLLILSVLTIRSITNVAVSPLPNIVRAIHGILGHIRQNQLLVLVARISLP